MTYDAKEHDEGERAIRSERGSKPVTPVVPLSESAESGSAAGQRPARPTAPPATKPSATAPPAVTSATAPSAAASPATAPPQAPRLIPQDECDKLNLRLQEALSTFIDGPRRSVEEAADVLDEAAKRLTAALAERPRTLRESWDARGDGSGDGGEPAADTEDLRLVLRSYREVTERLLRI